MRYTSMYFTASLLGLTILASGCGNITPTDETASSKVSTSTTTSAATSSSISITPSSVTLSPSSIESFAASGGTLPYTYTVYSGGGSVVSSTGIYTAPSASGSAYVEVQDATGLTAFAQITISTSSSSGSTSSGASATLTFTASADTVGEGSSIPLYTSGGSGSYTYSILSGGGSISGSTYTASSPGTVVLEVVDTEGNNATLDITVTGSYTCTCPFSMPEVSLMGACAGSAVSGAWVTTSYGTWAGSQITCSTDLGYASQLCYDQDHVHGSATTPELGYEKDTGSGILWIGYWRCTEN